MTDRHHYAQHGQPGCSRCLRGFREAVGTIAASSDPLSGTYPGADGGGYRGEPAALTSHARPTVVYIVVTGDRARVLRAA